MTQKTFLSVVRLYLAFGFVYLVGEGFVHTTGVRMSDALAVMSPDVAVIMRMFMQLWGFSAWLVAGLTVRAFIQPLAHTWLLKILAAYAFGLTIVLTQLLPRNFDPLYVSASSLVVWLPTYNIILFFEFCALISFVMVIGYGAYKKFV